MKLIRPTTVTTGMLVSSTAPETDYAAWASGTTYAVGNRVIKTSTHRIYESLQASNTNHDPETSPTWWLDIGPTNRWAMFDNKVGTKTTIASPLTVVINTGRIDSVALLEVDAKTVTVSMVSSATTVYSRTVDMIDETLIGSWFDYFFEPVVSKDTLVLVDLPVYGDSQLTVTLSKTSGSVACGICVVGLQADLGTTLRSPTLGINDYSRKTTDDFGNTTLVQRAFAKRMSVKLALNSNEVDRVARVLAQVRATPVVWVGADEYAAMQMYGFYRDFEVDIAYPNVSYCSLNIEGMI